LPVIKRLSERDRVSINIDLNIQKLTEELAIKYIIDDDHFINDFLSQCDSAPLEDIEGSNIEGHLVNTSNELF